MASASTGLGASSKRKSEGLSILQQDRQARNKPLLNATESPDQEYVTESNRGFSASYELAERSKKAATILDNPDLLMTYADAMQDSMAGVRQIFTKILCGYEDNTTKEIWGGLKLGRVPDQLWNQRNKQYPKRSRD